MAERPVFLAIKGSDNLKGDASNRLVREVQLSFKWVAGLSAAQKRKNVASLHEAARAKGILKVLEVSTKSGEPLGLGLSAFNLMIAVEGRQQMTLECAFQGSKVFTKGVQFPELYELTSREAKQYEGLRTSGDLEGFNFDGLEFPLEPKTAFYDWLYAKTLAHQVDVLEQLDEYEAFSDIEFNPNKSINCQARSCAVTVSLFRLGMLDEAVESIDAWLETLRSFQEYPLANHVQQSFDIDV
jgi:hypothetical protein